jgi:hypothetical protein
LQYRHSRPAWLANKPGKRHAPSYSVCCLGRFACRGAEFPGAPGADHHSLSAGFDMMSTTPEQTAAMLTAEHQRWAAILPGLNIRLD